MVYQDLLRQCIQFGEIYFDSIILHFYIRHITVIGHVIGNRFL